MATPTIARPIDLDTIHLGEGAHQPNNDGQWCLLEAVAWVAGETWTDSPQCVCPVLAGFGRRLNDLLPDNRRQELRPFIPAMVGTAGDGHQATRRFMALDWSLRTATPLWMDAADQPEAAARLREIGRAHV